MTQYNEWKIWNGGKCPVEPGTMGQVHLRDDTRFEAQERGVHYIELWNWCNVIAYRTVKDPVVEVIERTVRVEYRGSPLHIKQHITLTDGKVTAVDLAK